MNPIGLILEGGGMRGAFTAGVLDCWMDEGIRLDDVYGVSAGACQACSYLCGQRGRGLRVWVDYLNDPRFCSTKSLITTGDLFGAELNYRLIPRELDPLDNAAFHARRANFFAVVTNVETGLAEYLPVRDMFDDILAVQASASLPLVSNIIRFRGKRYLDGGVADSIPLRRAIADGHQKNVVVLTQAAGYRKAPNRAMALVRVRYARYPKLVRAIGRRHIVYNETLDFVDAEAASGRAFVLRPDAPPDVGRVEHDPDKLRRLHDAGYEVARRELPGLRAFLES